MILVGERVSAVSRHSSQQPSEPSRYCRVMYTVDDTLAFWIVLAGVAKYSQVLDSIAVYSRVFRKTTFFEFRPRFWIYGATG